MCLKCVATQNLPVPNEVKRLEARRCIKKITDERMEKFNAEHKLLSFKVGEMVLLKALNVCRSEDNTAATFFRSAVPNLFLSRKPSYLNKKMLEP